MPLFFVIFGFFFANCRDFCGVGRRKPPNIEREARRCRGGFEDAKNVGWDGKGKNLEGSMGPSYGELASKMQTGLDSGRQAPFSIGASGVVTSASRMDGPGCKSQRICVPAGSPPGCVVCRAILPAATQCRLPASANSQLPGLLAMINCFCSCWLQAATWPSHFFRLWEVSS